MPKNILIAPHSFKGSLTSVEASKVIANSLKEISSDLRLIECPVADGGDGTLETFKFYFKNSKIINTVVYDPLFRKIKSKWLMLDKNTALIELAQASGIVLLKKKELNPFRTSTFGTGQLILSAIRKGCKKIILTLGGSATIDGGVGILSSFGAVLLDKNGKSLKPNGSALKLLDKIDFSKIDKKLLKIKFLILSDVESKLLGENGITKFAIQKGARKRDLKEIDLYMKNYLKIVKKNTKKDTSTLPGVCAAGGVAFMFSSFFDSEVVSGVDYLISKINLKKHIKSADLVITGEGYLDSQSLLGKAPYKIAKLAGNCKKKVIVICGNYKKNINWKRFFIDKVLKIKTKKLTLVSSMARSKLLIKKLILRNYKLFINS